MSTNPVPYAQILNSGEVVAIIILNSAQAQQAQNAPGNIYNYVSIYQLTCTDGTPIVPGCTYQGGTTFTSLPKDNFGRSVTMTSDLSTDTYTVTDLAGIHFSLPFPTGTAQAQVYTQINATDVPTPGYALSVILSLFYTAIEAYLDAVYDADGKDEILILYLDALPTGSNLPTRLTYLKQFTAWYNSVTAYKVSFATSLQAQKAASNIFQATWDIPANTQPIPNVTAAGALAISN